MAHTRVEATGDQFSTAGQFGLSHDAAPAQCGLRRREREHIKGHEAHAHKRRSERYLAAEQLQPESIQKTVHDSPGCQHGHEKSRAGVSAPEQDILRSPS